MFQKLKETAVSLNSMDEQMKAALEFKLTEFLNRRAHLKDTRPAKPEAGQERSSTILSVARPKSELFCRNRQNATVNRKKHVRGLVNQLSRPAY